jgi:gas vesicle protein
MNNNTKMIVGVFAAVAAGVAIGMLLAPDKGEATRKKIRSGFGQLSDKLNDLVTEGQDMLAAKTEELRDNINAVKEDVKTTAQHTGKIIS